MISRVVIIGRYAPLGENLMAILGKLGLKRET